MTAQVRLPANPSWLFMAEIPFETPRPARFSRNGPRIDGFGYLTGALDGAEVPGAEPLATEIRAAR